jgi:hypothetical protein
LGDGEVTLDREQATYYQARKVMDASHRFAIRARPRKAYELTGLRDHEPLVDQSISLTMSGAAGMELYTAAKHLIDRAHGLLFDP